MEQFRLLSTWFQTHVMRVRRTRRRSHLRYATRTRSRTSTVSSYHSACDELKNTRISASNPIHHPDSFTQPARPWKLQKLNKLIIANKEERSKHAFNPKDCSRHMHVLEDGTTVHRDPIAQSTDGVRGKIGYSNGFHLFRFRWSQRHRGSHACVGVGTEKAAVHRCGYSSLIGEDEQSFGWDLVRNACFNDRRHKDSWTYPYMTANYMKKAPDVFFMMLDMDEGYVAFMSESEYYGVAFRGLRGMKLYPMISAVWGHCEISMDYLGSLHLPPPLMEICRRTIRYNLGEENCDRINELELPAHLIEYLDV